MTEHSHSYTGGEIEPVTVVRTLADLPPRSLITEAGLAEVFSVSGRTVRRMVNRGQLPPPVKLADRNTWMVGLLLDYLEEQMQQAVSEGKRIMKLRRGA